MIFFTSDLHFNHKNIIHLCNRPFVDVDEMNKALIQNWNSKVKKTDEVYILGDFGMFRNIKEANEMLDKLNGKKYLIRGNHDKFLYKDGERSDHFLHVEWVKDYYTFKHEGQKIVLSHYPIYEWDGYFSGSTMFHGHIHSDNVRKDQLYLCGLGRLYDVGVDVNDFMPISINEVIEKLQHVENVIGQPRCKKKLKSCVKLFRKEIESKQNN